VNSFVEIAVPGWAVAVCVLVVLAAVLFFIFRWKKRPGD